jgi:cysteine desulfurase
VHAFGQEPRRAIEEARRDMARLLGAASPDEIIFTSGGTESDNLAVKGIAWAHAEQGRHLITTQIEHHAVLYTCEYLEKLGFSVTILPVDEHGRVSPEDVRKALTPKTTLVSIMHANNEIGTIQPIAEIGRLLAEVNRERTGTNLPRIHFHTDAVQTAGKLAINVQELGVDLLALSAHKFYGPKGVGALYIRQGTVIAPQMHGGHHERNLRAGTENVPGIIGMTKALAVALGRRDEENARLQKLRDRLQKGILETVPAVKLNGHPTERIPGILNVSFNFIEGESLLLSLDLEGIAASAGSACASGSMGSSHVLKAMNVDPVTAQGTIRFSLGHANTDQDIDHVLAVLPRLVQRLRDASPLWQHSAQKK